MSCGKSLLTAGIVAGIGYLLYKAHKRGCFDGLQRYCPVVDIENAAEEFCEKCGDKAAREQDSKADGSPAPEPVGL